jgi:hypothetical protein
MLPLVFHAHEPVAQVGAIFRIGLHRLDFFKNRREVLQADDHGACFVIAPGNVFTDASDQNRPLNTFEAYPTIKPIARKNLVCRGSRRFNAGAILQHLSDFRHKLGKIVGRRLLCMSLIRPKVFLNFNRPVAQRAFAKTEPADTGRLHLTKIEPHGVLCSIDAFCQLREATFKHSGVSSRVQAEVNKEPEGSIAEQIQCLLHFGSGRKPTSRILQDKSLRAHTPSFPEACRDFLTGRMVSPESVSL